MQIQQEALEEGQQAVQQVAQFPLRQAVDWQRNSAQLLMNGLKVSQATTQQTVDITQQLMGNYLRTIESIIPTGPGMGGHQRQQIQQGHSQQSQRGSSRQSQPRQSQLVTPQPPAGGVGAGSQQSMPAQSQQFGQERQFQQPDSQQGPQFAESAPPQQQTRHPRETQQRREAQQPQQSQRTRQRQARTVPVTQQPAGATSTEESNTTDDPAQTQPTE